MIFIRSVKNAPEWCGNTRTESREACHDHGFYGLQYKKKRK
ncbi:hypothetical protein [Sinomicrobium oceani]|nr:hypothetical protein [Sinomicrobium oceani]